MSSVGDIALHVSLRKSKRDKNQHRFTVSFSRYNCKLFLSMYMHFHYIDNVYICLA